MALLRHGEQQQGPEGQGGDLFSVGDHPLSDGGRREAEAARDLLQHLPLEACVASPFIRCRETAEVVAAPHGLEVEVAPALAEAPFVAADEDPLPGYDEVLHRIRSTAARLWTGEDPQLPTGERVSEVRERVVGAVAEAREGRDAVLVVAHGVVNRLVIGDALGMPLARTFAIEQAHGCVNLVEYRDGWQAVRLVNGTPGRLPEAQTG